MRKKLKDKNAIIIIVVFCISLFLISCSFNDYKKDNNSSKSEGVNSSVAEAAQTSVESAKEAGQPADIIDLSVDEFYELLNSTNDIFLLDVRTEEEYDEGHLDNSVLIPLQELELRLNEIPKDKPILVYCRSGNRSRQAAKILIDNGFLEIYNMTGGITDWQEKGYPVVK